MLYLASQSSRRRRLLAQLGRPFRVVRSVYRESARRGESPAAAVIRYAVGKARRAKLPRRANGIVIGADTALYFRRRVIGKPRSLREARRMLEALSGQRHWVYTGLCLIDTTTGRMRTSYERSRVTFHRLSERVITRLLVRGSPLDKAGGYALQEDRGELIARLEGSRTNVIGLPMERLRQELAALERLVTP